MESVKRTYYKIEGHENLPIIQLSTIELFEELVDRYQPDFLFVSEKTEKVTTNEKDLMGRNKSADQKISYFAFYQDGLVYSVNAQNFDSLEAYKAGMAKGFSSGADYEKALNAKFIDHEEYQASKDAGFGAERVDYLRALQEGFVGSGDKIKTAYAEKRIGEEQYKRVKELKTDAQVYYFAKEADFESYEEYEQALESGFVKGTAQEFREAKEKGFEDSAAYYQAKQGGFADLDAYNKAQELGIQQEGELATYQNLEGLRTENGFRTIEHAHLYQLLADLEMEESISVEKIWDMLRESQTELFANQNGRSGWFNQPIRHLFNRDKHPDWYTTAFKDVVELKVFLISNENVGKLGLYDADGEVFERKNPEEEVIEAEITDTTEVAE